MDKKVEMINAFFFPHFFAIFAIIGITIKAVMIALMVLNHAGHVPAAS